MDTPGSRALRRGRWSEPGRIYLVTFTTHCRARHFADWEAARVAAACFDDPSTWREARLQAWVLMPDHWHGLLELGEAHELSRAIGRAKALATIALRISVGLQRPVWARGFHDRALRQEEDLKKAARYLVTNPLRARLVQRVGDYPFWNATWMCDGNTV